MCVIEQFILSGKVQIFLGLRKPLGGREFDEEFFFFVYNVFAIGSFPSPGLYIKPGLEVLTMFPVV